MWSEILRYPLAGTALIISSIAILLPGRIRYIFLRTLTFTLRALVQFKPIADFIAENKQKLSQELESERNG